MHEDVYCHSEARSFPGIYYKYSHNTDLPFGEKTLKLSSNAENKVPNVVRSLIPEQIVLQYLGYCKDVGLRQ